MKIKLLRRFTDENHQFEILGHSLKNMGISLGVTGNLDITTRHYVEVRNTRKAEVLKTYHKAVMNKNEPER